jgi:hypothetical protein
MAHRVKTHHWIDGMLSFVEKEFDSLEEALKHAEEAICHNVKVYNDLGQVVHYDVKRHKQSEDGTYA